MTEILSSTRLSVPSKWMASCASILYISVTPGSKTPISAPSRTKTPAVAGNGVPAHRTSAGRTQGTRVSAAGQLASSKALLADRGRVIQPKSESCPMDGDMEKERPTPWHRTLHGPRTTADGIWPSQELQDRPWSKRWLSPCLLHAYRIRCGWLPWSTSAAS